MCTLQDTQQHSQQSRTGPASWQAAASLLATCIAANTDWQPAEGSEIGPYGMPDAHLVASRTSSQRCLPTLQLQVPLSPCRCSPSGAAAWDDNFGELTAGDLDDKLVTLCADAARRGRCHMLTAGCSTLHGAFRMVMPSSLRYLTSSVRRYERKHSTAT